MSKFADQTVAAAFQPYLQPNEVLVNSAYCAYRPPQTFGCLLELVSLFLPHNTLEPAYRGALARFYLVALTDRSFIVLPVSDRSGTNIQGGEVFGYRLDQLPEIRATFSNSGTVLEINDPARQLKVEFGSKGLPNNDQRGQMIAKALSSLPQRQFAGATNPSQHIT